MAENLNYIFFQVLKRIIIEEKALQLLREHGLPKKRNKEIKEMFQRLKEHDKENPYTIKDAREDFFEILRKCQETNKGKEKNNAAAVSI